MTEYWEEVEHTADWALRVWGRDLRALFEHAAQAMLSLIGGIAENDREIIRESYKLSAQDNETLLIDWLTELLYLVEDRHALFTSVRVEMVENCVLHAAVTAQTSKNFTKHIKAVTYHDLAIKKIPDGYEVTIVFDV